MHRVSGHWPMRLGLQATGNRDWRLQVMHVQGIALTGIGG